MANFTQNLTDSIRFFAPATKFGTPMKWGVDSWGSQIGSSGNFPLQTASKVTNQDFGPTLIDQFGVPLFVAVSDLIVFAQGNMQSETLRDRAGFYFVFGGGFTNDESVSNPVYTTLSNQAASWSLSTNSSTSWVTN